MYEVLNQQCYLDDPHRAAHTAWADIFKRSGKYPLANGAVMRTSILGIPFFWDLDKVESLVCASYVDSMQMSANSEAVCKITHYDPRCVASCVAVNTVIALLLQGEIDADTSEGKHKLTTLAFEQVRHGNIQHLNRTGLQAFIRSYSSPGAPSVYVQSYSRVPAFG